MNVISACTRNCHDGCSLITRVRNGKVVSVEGNDSHPITQGSACPRMKLFAKNIDCKDRLRTPLRRKGDRGSGEFEVVSWEGALKEASDKILAASRDYGSSSIALYNTGGNTGMLADNFPYRFINAINGSVFFDTICHAAGDAALRYNFGSTNGYLAERIQEAKLVVLWGINSKWSNIHGAALVQKAKRKGASIWVIDPIKTQTAEIGRHLQIRPGTDAVLALTLINHIIENDMHDKDFIEKYVKGFSNLVGIAKKYDINKAAEMTGLKAAEIVELASEVASYRPGVIQIGFGLQRQRNGGEMVRAISLIPSIVGQHRGFLYTSGSNGFDYDYIRGTKLRTSPVHQHNPLGLPRLIREGVVKVLIVINSNPLANLPNQNALRSAIHDSDATLITHDMFMTDTAGFSDLVLPATTMFEHLDAVPSFFHDTVNLNEKAVSPVGDSKSNVDFFKALARAMGMHNPELFEDEESILRYVFKCNPRVDGDLKVLKHKGFERIKALPNDVYPTPSGKIEIFSEMAAADGLQAVPDHVPIKGAGRYQLLTPETFEMNHSSYHILSPGLVPKVMINPEDASAEGIKDGKKVKLSNHEGSIAIAAEVSDRVPKGVLVSYTGLWANLSGGSNINFLTTDFVQKYGGGSAYHSTFVNLSL